MKHLFTTKYIILIISAFYVLTGCRKELMVTKPSAISVKPANGLDSTKILTEDDLVHMITIDLGPQTVKTQVTDNKLTMTYTEDVTALLPYKGYDLSFSIRLNEDFSSSGLAKFDYTLPGTNGTTTNNWAGNDLKILNEVTKTQYTFNEQTRVKLHLTRTFTFVKQYITAAIARQAQATFIGTKTDVVTFSTFVVFGKDYPATTAKATLVYVKN